MNNNIIVINKIDESASVRTKYDLEKVPYEILDEGSLNHEEQLVKLLAERKQTITTAESCTGGMISSTIVDVPGASSIFNEAYVTYANEAKSRLLKVPENILDTCGAVSKETAYYMAVGAAAAAGADAAIAVTGIAGPDGGSEEKPVGTVYAGLFYMGSVKIIRYNFDGDRLTVRKKTTENVISDMYTMIKQHKMV